LSATPETAHAISNNSVRIRPPGRNVMRDFTVELD
jgi:hypothetical protein